VKQSRDASPRCTGALQHELAVTVGRRFMAAHNEEIYARGVEVTASTAPSTPLTRTFAVDLLGRYSNPDIVARLNRILSGQGRDRPSHRTVPSVTQKPTRLADSDRNEVIERYLAGETASALASIYDVNRATVFTILQRAGIKSRNRILTDHDIAAATDMYENGQSLASIAKHFDVSDGTVLQAFRRLGIPTRPQGSNQWSQKPARPPA
jgi:DNA invertase Pin-like site-specific DNA recombinase